MPQHFKESGYETVSLGKVYHHARDDNELGWSVQAWRPQGAWKGRGYLDPESLSRVRPPNQARGDSGVGPAYEAADVADAEYPDGHIARKAIRELRRLKRAGKPFFLAVGLHKPHLPFNAPRPYWERYRRDDIRQPLRQAWPEGMPEIAGSNWGELRKYAGMPESGPVPADEAVRLIHGYYACVSYVDALVGQVLDALDRLDLRQQTIVVLWGDHGWKLGDYGAWCKHTNFERDTRVPLILSVPGRGPEGQRSEALVEFVDIFPTLSQLCGLEIPESCEGTSMAPLLHDPARRWKEAAMSQYPRGSAMGYSIRCGQWRYTEWIDRTTGAVKAKELYDHAAGALAERNWAGAPRFASTVERLSRVLDRGQGWRGVRERLPP
jgi:iduronate 2-sulfatase